MFLFGKLNRCDLDFLTDTNHKQKKISKVLGIKNDIPGARFEVGRLQT